MFRLPRPYSHRRPPAWFQRELQRRDRNLSVRWDARKSRWLIEHWNPRWNSWDTILHVVHRDTQGQPIRDQVRPLDRTVLALIDDQDTYKRFGPGSIPRQIENRLDSRDAQRMKNIETDTVEMAREATRLLAPMLYEKLTHTKLGPATVEQGLSGTKSVMDLDPAARARYLYKRKRPPNPGDMLWSSPNS